MNEIDYSIYDGLTLLPENLQGWGSNSSIFSDLIGRIRPKRIIEVGTWKGGSAITMGKCVKKLGLQCEIICVDTWLGSTPFWTYHRKAPCHDLMLKNGYPTVFYQFLSNVVHSGLQNIILPLPNTSEIASRILRSRKVTADLIYIDASHDYEDVQRDIKNYWGLVQDGGILFGHDYCHGFPGVMRAVQEFSEEHSLTTEVYHSFWMFSKSEIRKRGHNEIPYV